MKNKFLEFLQKYWFCFLMSVLKCIGKAISTYYADSLVIGSDMIKFDLSDLYLIYVVPVYSLIYGISSYVRTKKIWVPQLILYVITCMYYFGFSLIVYKDIGAWENILMVSLSPVVFSLIGVGIVVYIRFVIINPLKEKQN